jgi:hypothetical protein
MAKAVAYIALTRAQKTRQIGCVGGGFFILHEREIRCQINPQKGARTAAKLP